MSVEGNRPGNSSDTSQPELTLSADVRQQLQSLLDPDEPLRCGAEADMVLPATFGTSWLVATDRRIAVYAPNGGPPATLVDVPLAEAVKLRKRMLNGSNVLELHTATQMIPLVRYTDARAEPVEETAEAIRALIGASGEEEEEEAGGEGEGPRRKTRSCEQCGKPVPRLLGVCPDCIDRRRLFLRLLQRTKPYARSIAFSFVLAMIATAADLYQAPLTKQLVDVVIPDHNFHLLVQVILILLGIRVANAALMATRQYLMSWLGEKVTFDLRGELYEHLQRLGVNYYDQKETGWMMDRVTSDTTNLQDFMTDAMQRAALNAITLVIIACYMFKMHPLLAALSLFPAPIVCYMSARFMKKTHKIWHWAYRRRSHLFSLLSNVLPGVRVVKAFVQEDRERERFHQRSQSYMDANINAARVFATFNRTTGFVMGLSSLTIWGYGGYLAVKGEQGVTPGLLIAFMQLVMRFYQPLQELTGLSQRFQRAAAAAQRVFEVLDTNLDMDDNGDAIELPRVEGRIEFRNVTFGYDERRPVLKNVSFVANPGEMIGVVGPSGAGKSTTINLICRFYDVNSGAILVDGYDVRDVKLRSLREQIGIVLQEPFLFHGTIAENIAYGCPHAAMPDIIRAAKAANAHDFVLRFPDGYDTMVGERGARLSGGERQRISIARAILKNPRILILDEATSSVDAETEAQIREAIDRLIEGRTTFAIAHRFSTIQSANRLIVLERGRVVETGTQAELLANEDGIFRRLVDVQKQLADVLMIGG
jgi:ATP-binding cassette, subfamily B, bacterial